MEHVGGLPEGVCSSREFRALLRYQERGDLSTLSHVIKHCGLVDLPQRSRPSCESQRAKTILETVLVTVALVVVAFGVGTRNGVGARGGVTGKNS